MEFDLLVRVPGRTRIKQTLATFLYLVFLTSSVGLWGLTEKPNIILLIADDQGWGDVGYHGSEISTPNIDQLAKEGLEMNRWYSYPWCGPTRTALLTGHIAGRHGSFFGGANLTHDEPLLNEALQDAGYMTMTAGKWHLGHNTQADFPINRGFDHTYGSLGAGVDYYTHASGEVRDWARDGETVFENGYMTDLFGNEISRLIRERDPSKPFFTYAAFTAPHTPLQAPQEYIDKYAHIEDESRRIYCAMVEVLDVAIGNILQTVDDEGIRDNTLVLYFSDNGGNVRAGGASNGELRDGKSSLHEGGTRLPAIFRWPGKIPAGVKSEQPMVVHDLFPTLLDALSLKPNLNTPFDGESLWDVLQTGKTRPRKADLVITAPYGYSVHAGDFKLIHTNLNKSQAELEESIELFKIYEDPNEKINVAGDYPDVVNQMISNTNYVTPWIYESGMPTRGRFAGGGPAGRGRAGGPNAAGPRAQNAQGGAGGGPRGGGRGGAGPGPRRGAAADPVPVARDSDGNIIHLHESVAGD